MRFLADLSYPAHEEKLNQRLAALFSDWYAAAQTRKFLRGHTADDIVFDGFYPNYTSQRVKVLFVGREALGICGENYIEILHGAYKNNHIGNKHINQHKFHNLMFYITYGVNNGFPEWDSIPSASELSGDFATERGISFAFMNLSKLSNESEDWTVDWALVDSFVDSFSGGPRNYFRDEIEILAPDVIISMNLEGRLAALGEMTVQEYGSEISTYHLTVADRDILLMDLFHFSAPNKSSRDMYYEKVKQALRGSGRGS